MSDETVPVRAGLPASARARELVRRFAEDFGEEAQFVVRVPGRVNLIGEHVDYCGFPVLPMALQQCVLVAARAQAAAAPRLALRNLDPRYEPFSAALSDLRVDVKEGEEPRWYNYVICGVKGAMELLEERARVAPGVALCVWGDVPAAAGLSSSSALVSAACLAVLHAAGLRVPKRQVAALCAASERHIGTQGGGMDQAIAFLARKGAAQYITWNPLGAAPVPLPADAAFVVAHSMTRANKAASYHFNQRVIECRLAAAVLAKRSNIALDSKQTLSDIGKTLNKSLDELLDLVKRHIVLDVYSKADICELLNIEEEALTANYLTADTCGLSAFKLRQRATHVLQEAQRVEQFRAACAEVAAAGAAGRGGGAVRRLGELMRSSHRSLEELYECSRPELDRLVRLADAAGAHARLTGAGWGGCVVALCPAAKLDGFLQILKQEFYSQIDQVDDLLFTTAPNDGAEVYEI